MLQKFDQRNRDLIVNINGELLHRDKAGISPFDSAVQGGDAVWEGLRLYNGRIFKLNEHLDRLERSARALSFAEIPPHEEIIDEIKNLSLLHETEILERRIFSLFNVGINHFARFANQKTISHSPEPIAIYFGQ